jgi:hypothetical protein
MPAFRLLPLLAALVFSALPVAVLAPASLTGSVSPAQADGTPIDPEGLIGGPRLVVLRDEKDFPAEIRAAGVTPEQIRATTESKLRAAGIEVLASLADLLPGDGVVGISFQMQSGGFSPVSAISIHIAVLREARVENGPEDPLGVIVWSDSTIVRTSTSSPDLIRSAVETLLDGEVDQLVTDYLAANPR